MKVCVLLIVFSAAVSVFAAAPRVFGVNLTSDSIDINIISDGKTILNIAEVEPYSAVKLTEIPAGKKVSCRYKRSADADYLKIGDDKGAELVYKADENYIYAVVVRPSGGVEVCGMKFAASDSPKLALLNESGSSIKYFALGESHKKPADFKVENVVSGAMSGFYDVTSETVKIYWQNDDDSEKYIYHYYPDDTRKSPMNVTLSKENYYLFVIYNGEFTNNAALIRLM